MNTDLSYGLLYTSTPTRPPSADDLAKLLVRARANNETRGITGSLTYLGYGGYRGETPGHYVQWLEGPEEALCELFYGRITHDPRHTIERIEFTGPIRDRVFPTWSMDFRRAEAAPDAIRAVIVNLLGRATAR